MRHLSDEIIQKYLDSGERVDKTVVESHFIVCPECRDKLEQYRELYRRLSLEMEIEPDESLNLHVLKAVENWELQKKSRKLVHLIAAFGGLVVLTLSLVYFDLFSWHSVTASLQSAFSKATVPMLETVSHLLKELNGNLELLAFASLALLLFQLLDYGLVKPKVNRLR